MESMHRSECENFAEKLSAYFDEELSEQEAQGLLKHLATCDECKRRLEEYQMIRKLSSEQRQKSPIDFSDTILSMIERNQLLNNFAPEPSGPKRLIFIFKILATAAMLIAVGSTVFILTRSPYQARQFTGKTNHITDTVEQVIEKKLKFRESPKSSSRSGKSVPPLSLLRRLKGQAKSLKSKEVKKPKSHIPTTKTPSETKMNIVTHPEAVTENLDNLISTKIEIEAEIPILMYVNVQLETFLDKQIKRIEEKTLIPSYLRSGKSFYYQSDIYTSLLDEDIYSVFVIFAPKSVLQRLHKKLSNTLPSKLKITLTPSAKEALYGTRYKSEADINALYMWANKKPNETHSATTQSLSSYPPNIPCLIVLKIISRPLNKNLTTLPTSAPHPISPKSTPHP